MNLPLLFPSPFAIKPHQLNHRFLYMAIASSQIFSLMANLLKEDLAFIVKHPLDDSLNHLWDSLKKADQFYKLSLTSDNGTGNTYVQGLLNAVSKLLNTLAGHDVAFTLFFKIRNENLASELLMLFRCVQNKNFNYQQYRPLILLVIKKASDIDIWNAVFNLMQSISQIIPPISILSLSIPPSFNDILIIYFSALMQGEEQTKRLLENLLFNEIKNCTYQGIEGFFKKYFKMRKWFKQSKEIYQALKNCHINSWWINFPDSPDERTV